MTGHFPFVNGRKIRKICKVKTKFTCPALLINLQLFGIQKTRQLFFPQIKYLYRLITIKVIQKTKMLHVVKRIRGQDLSKHVGEEVILLGKIGMLSPNGKSLELVTFDDVKVNVTLPEPFDGSPDCYLEVHGTVQSKTTVLCNSSFVFPLEDNVNVSTENYNEMLLIGNLLGDKKWAFDETPSF